MGGVDGIFCRESSTSIEARSSRSSTCVSWGCDLSIWFRWYFILHPRGEKSPRFRRISFTLFQIHSCNGYLGSSDKCIFSKYNLNLLGCQDNQSFSNWKGHKRYRQMSSTELIDMVPFWLVLAICSGMGIDCLGWFRDFIIRDSSAPSREIVTHSMCARNVMDVTRNLVSSKVGGTGNSCLSFISITVQWSRLHFSFFT